MSTSSNIFPAPIVLATASGVGSGSATTLTGNAPAGSLVALLAVAAATANVAVTAVSDSGGNTYTQAVASVLNASYRSASIWYSANITHALVGGTSTITVTVSGGYTLYAVALLGSSGGLASATATANQNTSAPSLSSGALGSPAQVVFAGLNATGALASVVEAPAFAQFSPSLAANNIDFAYAIPGADAALTYNPTNSNTLFISSVSAAFYMIPSPTTVLSYLNAFPGMPFPQHGSL
jgi:hypothetical protein